VTYLLSKETQNYRCQADSNFVLDLFWLLWTNFAKPGHTENQLKSDEIGEILPSSVTLKIIEVFWLLSSGQIKKILPTLVTLKNNRRAFWLL